jgi:hypothetical protein
VRRFRGKSPLRTEQMQNQNIKITVSSLLTLFLVGLVLQGQSTDSSLSVERFLFCDCENQEGICLENCFYNSIKVCFLKIISYQKTLVKNNYKGVVKVLLK